MIKEKEEANESINSTFLLSVNNTDNKDLFIRGRIVLIVRIILMKQ